MKLRILVPLLAAIAVAPLVFAQGARRELAGHVRPGVATANDRGRINAARSLQHVTLILKPSDQREAELHALLARQQDPSSPDFHKWLTPEEFGERFGLPQADIDQVTTWLAGQNLRVDSVARGRTTIAFSGNVRDVERALQTEIHNYTINGEDHFANASDPSVPASIGGWVRAVRGLDNFRMKPRSVRRASSPLLTPHYTYTDGSHNLAPDDIATIFDVAPLYNSGITGKGQKIAVVGQTKIILSDIQRFRTFFNLPANDPTLLLVPNTADPGVLTGDDLDEADLDVELSGAIARDANVIYVYSPDVVTSLFYAIDNNIAPVISMSYGQCEQLGFQFLSSLNTYALQAYVQGISWIAASGDTGANDCLGISGAPPGLSVDAPASVPYVTGVGGTTLTEGAGQYWNTTNNLHHASARSYIPESVWNDATTSSAGGGASIYFQKPVWQVGPGVPNDGLRDVPDISLPASADHDGYLIYTDGGFALIGGTSAGAPAFAGMTALLNQYLLVNGYPTSGSLNPRLYALAQTVPNAFHDVTAGNNITVSCSQKSCASTFVGYDAAPGYDLASGLGSVDLFNMVLAWPTPATPKTPVSVSLIAAGTTTLTATVTGTGSLAPTGPIYFYASGTLLGTVSLNGASSTATASLNISATQLGVGDAGQVVVSAVYNGDSVYAGMSAFATVTVPSATAISLTGVTSAASFQKTYAPGMIISLFGLNLAGSTPDSPPAPLPTQLAGTTVTINEIVAPLYYVSPTQINVQIPWEIPRDSVAVVKVSAGGQTATTSIGITRFAPQVFADTNGMLVPYDCTIAPNDPQCQRGARGTVAFLFATGDGLFGKPSVVTGSTPPAGTITAGILSATITVGGVIAPITFIGEPAWSVGVSQFNFTIPANAPPGKQPVVVNIGGNISAPVYITVTQ